MELMKENAKQKTNNKFMIIIGALLALAAICLLCISIPDSNAQAVSFCFDPVTLILYVLIGGICVMLTKKKTNGDILKTLKCVSIPVGAFIGVFKGIFALQQINGINDIGLAFGQVLPALMYGLVLL